jgi:hypothetical protein
MPSPNPPQQRHAHIYCPECGYRPKAEDRWACLPSCGTVWHTFWTGGVCPGCAHQWLETQCPACNKTSPHRHWYHYPDKPPDQERKRELSTPQGGR